MAKRILVPLDGSTTAESAIPLIADLARGGGAVVRLIHVAQMPENRYGADGRLVAYADQEITSVESEQRDYLSSVEVGLAEIPVEGAVRFGEPVREILAEAEQWGADLIAVTTAGRSGLGRLVLGSVAEAVFRKAHVPVILYHPGPVTA
jgi:nucleotide-binding universal stress UspA family protein